MRKLVWLLSMWVIILITGCRSPTTPVAVKPSDFIQPTIASTPSLTSPPHPSSTPVQKPTSTFILTLTNTTATNPTELIGVCRLPCWWGITPGDTNWDQALDSLLQSHGKGLTTSDISITVENGENDFVRFRRNEKDIIEKIYLVATPSNGVKYFDLLTEYGQPSDIYLFTYKNMQTTPPWLGLGERPAYVIFYYADMGILANYEFFGKVDDAQNIITVCPAPTSQNIQLSPKGTNLSFDEIKSFVMGISDFPMLKIEDSTSMSKNDFYMLYKDKEQTKCFETPASLWP
jgi:hypothetical protein